MAFRRLPASLVTASLLLSASAAHALGPRATPPARAYEDEPRVVVSGPPAAPEQDDDCADCEPERPRPGTHFIAEANGGTTGFGSGGPVFGGLLGAGGKLPRFPPRFYVIGELSQRWSSERGRLDGGIAYEDERQLTDLGVGLRIYLPVWGPVRVFGDAQLGRSYATASYRSDTAPRSTRDAGWINMAQVSVGPQVRILHHVSVGARARYTINEELVLDSSDGPARRAGGNRASFTGTLTAHF